MRSIKRPPQAAVQAKTDALSVPDVVACILSGNVGPNTFVAASRVCKCWHEICRSDGALLRRVALYQGGVTKAVFCGLFALGPRDAAQLPHTCHRRKGGGTFYLYGSDAIDRALELDGMHALRERIARRARSIARGDTRCALYNTYQTPRRLCGGVSKRAALEEYFHNQTRVPANCLLAA